MIERTKIYLEEKLEVKNIDKLLLAVSGGIDSMVMLDILHKINCDITIAHCNFQLRGKESNSDELLVKSTCERNNIRFLSTKFNTTQFAEKNSISIQMAARDLRYNWFEEIRKKQNLDFIAIAHNANDVVETFFINLSRGTGIKGLTGIKAKTDRIIRPLLPFSRSEIEKYATNNFIKFREDASNASDKYHRNRIRHNIIPELKKINPSFLETMLENIERINDASILLNNSLEKKRDKLIQEKNETILIHIDLLKKESSPSFILFEILNEYGFNASQVKDIILSLENQSGQEFYSPTHRLIKDREELILIKDEGKIKNKENLAFEIPEGTLQISAPIPLKFEYFEKPIGFQPTRNENIAELDAEKLTFPLKLRKWELGDYFYPLGMKNKKKLSDFFVDNKFSLFDKENTWLLTSGDDIVWIIGYRIDDRFKISGETSNILRIIV